MWSTYCGLRATVTSDSLTSIKKSLSSPLGRLEITSSHQTSSASKSPRFGIIEPLRMLNAVYFPIPFGPSIPTTDSLDGVGNLNSLNPFNEYRCIISLSSSAGNCVIIRASCGHLLTQIPHPMQSDSEICGLPVDSSMTTHSCPFLTGGQNVIHSSMHFLG